MNDVPLNTREYKLPRRPITVAPMNETMSERSKICGRCERGETQVVLSGHRGMTYESRRGSIRNVTDDGDEDHDGQLARAEGLHVGERREEGERGHEEDQPVDRRAAGLVGFVSARIKQAPHESEIRTLDATIARTDHGST